MPIQEAADSEITNYLEQLRESIRIHKVHVTCHVIRLDLDLALMPKEWNSWLLCMISPAGSRRCLRGRKSQQNRNNFFGDLGREEIDRDGNRFLGE